MRIAVLSRFSKTKQRTCNSHTVSEHPKSAITHVKLQENHVIERNGADIMNRETNRKSRWIKEAIHTRKEGKKWHSEMRRPTS